MFALNDINLVRFFAFKKDVDPRIVPSNDAQGESRSRKSEQEDKWNFCLTTAIIAVNRRNHEQTPPPEPLTRLQGEGGSGRRQGRPHNRPAGGAFRRSPQSDHGMEIAA